MLVVTSELILFSGAYQSDAISSNIYQFVNLGSGMGFPLIIFLLELVHRVSVLFWDSGFM